MQCLIDKLTCELRIELDATGDSSRYSDKLISLKIKDAINIAYKCRYPYDNGTVNQAIDYVGTSWLKRCATALLNTMGIEEQSSHTENNISRSYGDKGALGKLKNEIVPRGKNSLDYERGKHHAFD